MNQLFQLGEFVETEETEEKDLDMIQNLLKKHPEIIAAVNKEKETQNASASGYL